jgi:hypothetical protein
MSLISVHLCVWCCPHLQPHTSYKEIFPANTSRTPRKQLHTISAPRQQRQKRRKADNEEESDTDPTSPQAESATSEDLDDPGEFRLPIRGVPRKRTHSGTLKIAGLHAGLDTVTPLKSLQDAFEELGILRLATPLFQMSATTHREPHQLSLCAN